MGKEAPWKDGENGVPKLIKKSSSQEREFRCLAIISYIITNPLSGENLEQAIPRWSSLRGHFHFGISWRGRLICALYEFRKLLSPDPSLAGPEVERWVEWQRRGGGVTTLKFRAWS